MENKRNSVGGRVATPKNTAPPSPNPNGIPDLGAALLKAIDKRVRITTSLATYEGLLFTADPLTNFVVINVAAPGASAGNYRCFPVSQITAFTFVGGAPASEPNGSTSNGVASPTPGVPSFGDAHPLVARLDMEALRAREEEAVRKMHEHDATRGKNVTREGQEIFDWFKRTLPARWADQTIVVSDSVLVKPPYSLDDVSAPKNKADALAQIKRVLEGYYSKKGASSAANSGTSTPAANRPVVPAVPRKGG